MQKLFFEPTVSLSKGATSMPCTLESSLLPVRSKNVIETRHSGMMTEAIQTFSHKNGIRVSSFSWRCAGSFDAVKILPPRQVVVATLNKKSPLPVMTGGFSFTHGYGKLSSQIDQLSQEIVRRRNDSGIGLKTTLHRNHIHKFIPQIDIRGL